MTWGGGIARGDIIFRLKIQGWGYSGFMIDFDRPSRLIPLLPQVINNERSLSQTQCVILHHTQQSVCLKVWVCGSYVVHNFSGTELCCAPSTCIVRSYFFFRSKGPNNFSFFWWFMWEILKMDTFCQYLVHKPMDTQYNHLAKCACRVVAGPLPPFPPKKYNHSVVHNLHTNQGPQCNSVPTSTLMVHSVALY